ncbi:hypothetical protein ACIQMJ_30840 [Actinosynnema sp. NPDC091369]
MRRRNGCPQGREQTTPAFNLGEPAKRGCSPGLLPPSPGMRPE